MQTHATIRPHIEVYLQANAIRKRLRLNWNGFLEIAVALLGQYNDIREMTDSLAGRPEHELSSVTPEDNHRN